MAQQNLVSFQMNDKDLESVRAAIATLKTVLLPQLKTLTPEDRHELPKMGDKTVAFVQKTQEYCKSNPELCPQFMDADAFGVDVKAVETIRTIYNPLLQIVEALDDTMMLSGSEAYAGALMFYNSVKAAQKMNISSAGTIYDDLSSRFPGRPPKTNAAAATAETK